MSTLRVSGIVQDSIVDGPGLRLTVFTQGCPHHCPDCHNESTHDFAGGTIRTIEEIQTILSEDLLSRGITFSGGEPLVQAAPLAELAAFAHSIHKDVWVYTGYTWEEILADKDPSVLSLLQHTDVLIDGRFDVKQRDLTLLFRGSHNQRIIDVPKSLAFNQMIRYEL